MRLKKGADQLIVIISVLMLLVVPLLAACAQAPAPTPAPAPAPAPPKVKELRMQTFMQEGSIFAKTFNQFAGDVIRQQTNGQISIKLFPGNALVPPKEQFDGVKTGVLDLAHASPGRDAGKIGPIGRVALGMPFMWRNIVEGGVLIYELGIGDLLREAYGAQGVYYVGWANGTGTQSGIWSKVPIRTLDDFKGVKVRLSGGRPAAELFKKFGAEPISMGMGEIYTSLATGVIDAASASSTHGNEKFGFHEHTKYIIRPRYIGNYNTAIIANTNVWNSLTAQQQEIIKVAFDNWFYHSEYMERVAENEAMARMKTAGMEVITLPEADVKKLVEAAREGWEKATEGDPAAVKALEIIKDFLRSQGYID